MSVSTEKLIRYCGGVVFLLGVGVSFASIGRRTADPLAAMFFAQYTFLHFVGVLVVGLGLIGLGLGIAKQSERFVDEETPATTE